MQIEDMHYDFKKKLNKVDSNKNRNLLVPEIDWALNEALSIFIDLIATPRQPSNKGFETDQKTIDDLSPLVYSKGLVINTETDKTVIAKLPSDYRHFINGSAIISKNTCRNKVASLYPVKHTEKFEESPFDRSSFEWREVNVLFNHKGMLLHTDGTFTIDEVEINYIKQPVYMHYAQGFPGGKYSMPNGTVLTGKVNCELSESCCREIVDIAVAMVAGELQSNDYQIKTGKMNLNNIK